MKKTVFLIMLVSILIMPSFLAVNKATAAQAQNEATATGTLDRIEKIKELVASRVAELKLVEKKGFLGTVKESSNTQIIIDDNKGTQRIIDIDELTKFEDSSNKEFGVSDLKKGDLVSVIGLYNKDTKRLLSRLITKVKSLPSQFDGIVVSLDSKGFEIETVNEAGEKKTVEIERTTKTSLYSTSEGFVKSGFSKVEDGQRILVSGFFDTQDKDILIASRLIHFEDVPPSSSMKNFQVAGEIKDTTTSPTRKAN